MGASYTSQGWPRQQAYGDFGLPKAQYCAFKRSFSMGLNGALLRAAVTSILMQRGFAFSVAARTQNYEQPPNDRCNNWARWARP